MPFGTRYSSRLHRRWAALVLLLCVIGIPVSGPVGIARAQVRGTRALRSIRIDGSETGWTIEVHFEFPIRYLRHTPQRPSRMLHVEVDPLDLGGDEALEGLERELPIQTTCGALTGIYFGGLPPIRRSSSCSSRERSRSWSRRVPTSEACASRPRCPPLRSLHRGPRRNRPVLQCRRIPRPRPGPPALHRARSPSSCALDTPFATGISSSRSGC